MTNSIDQFGVPLPPGDWLYSERLFRALAVAAQIHAAQVRKGTTIPYLSHLLGTCSIAMEYGANEDEAIAALLHDAIEDGVPVEAARAAVRGFGPEVLRIVEACTDPAGPPRPSRQERKAIYLDRIAVEDHSVLLVSASDKLHNARSIVRDLREVGAAVWDRFSLPKEDTLAYYRRLVAAYAASPSCTPPLVAELDRTVTEMEALAESIVRQ